MPAAESRRHLLQRLGRFKVPRFGGGERDGDRSRAEPGFLRLERRPRRHSGAGHAERRAVDVAGESTRRCVPGELQEVLIGPRQRRQFDLEALRRQRLVPPPPQRADGGRLFEVARRHAGEFEQLASDFLSRGAGAIGLGRSQPKRHRALRSEGRLES